MSQQEQAQEPALDARLAAFSTYTTTPDEAIELFAEARPKCPVAHSDQLGGFHMLLRYDDVRDAHRNAATFSSSPMVTRPIAPRPKFPPLEHDEPEHGPWKALFQQAFNIQTPERMEPVVQQYAGELVDRFAERGTADLVEEYAGELPLLTLCQVIGVDENQRGELRRRAVDLIRSLGNPEQGPAAFMALAEFGIAQVLARREDPRDDFLTEIAQVEMDGRPLEIPEIGQAMASFLVAGAGTTIGGLSSLLYEVLSRPDLRARLQADRSLIPAAIEENMRLNPPFFGLYRRVTEPVTVAGVDLAPEESVFVCWAAANRDPDRFPDPDTFDLDRKRNRHMSFGFGIHACPGAPTARMQMRLALETLLDRLPDVELDPERPPTKVFGGTDTLELDALHVRFTPSGG